jgi:flagellar biogenesis protein FliO
MFDFFGVDMPLAVRFLLAFIVVLAVIGIAAWAVRRLGSARTGHSVRGRLPRLGVIDYAAVDSRRRLVLVRRDNVEHLVMIGGPSDVVVEANIAKEGPLSRGSTVMGDPELAETLARTLPLPEDGAKESWPLQQQQPPSWPRSPRDETIAQMHDEAEARPQRGAVRPQKSAPLPLTPELPVNPLLQRRAPSMSPRSPSVEPRTEAAKDDQERDVPRQQPAERAVSWPLQPEQPPSRPREPWNEQAPKGHENSPLMHDELHARPQRAPAPLPVSTPLPLVPELPVEPVPQRRGLSMPKRPPLAEPHAEVAGDYRQERGASPRHTPERSAVDESLAEMAQRLEATLRKSKSTAPTAAPSAPPQGNPSQAAASASSAPSDELEQQMASLLGRSSKKPGDFT